MSSRKHAWWVVGALLGSACVEPEPGARPPGPPPAAPVAELTIDPGAEVVLDPGAGAGVAVEYREGGRWRILAACDTALTQAFCHFDVLASSAESALAIADVEEMGLESEDAVLQPDPFALELDLITGEDLDAAAFTMSPGATLRVSVLIYDPLLDSPFDWAEDPRLLSWVGSGALHWGAPTNPLDLTPGASSRDQP